MDGEGGTVPGREAQHISDRLDRVLLDATKDVGLVAVDPPHARPQATGGQSSSSYLPRSH